MRQGKHANMLDVARVISQRSTCIRRKVGCVLTDADGVILGTGYNGVPRGWAHCNESDPCPGALSATRTDLDKCLAIHAEANALINCVDKRLISICYVTVSPCIHCIKLLLNTNCHSIFYGEIYDECALDLWRHSLPRRTAVWIKTND